MYTNEKNALILLSLLKAHGVRKIVVSPGSTNIPIVGSVQKDDFFEVYSSVDERSAAYIACGLAEASNELVAISCTGATASRNYLSGLTEAFYRKLPIVAITSFNGNENIGHLVPQNIDRTTMPNDTVNCSVHLPVVKDSTDEWYCNTLVNQALIEAKKDGCGPVHINISSAYTGVFDVNILPNQRVIHRYTNDCELPSLDGRKIAVFVGSHREFGQDEVQAIEEFCERRNAIVMCDHTSSYNGRYKIQSALISGNYGALSAEWKQLKPEIVIHLGEVSGDYPGSRVLKEAKEVWRVSKDGKVRDTGRKLSLIYHGSELSFFSSLGKGNESNEFYINWKAKDDTLRSLIPELPFSNLWLASKLSKLLPVKCSLHLGILNSLRSWNFFDTSGDVRSSCNVGGFGIDGCLSTALGSSIINPEIPHFVVLGDLAFFYDINSLANRFRTKNLRIFLINNGCGVEFNNTSHIASKLDLEANDYIAAGGHFNSGLDGSSNIMSPEERVEMSLCKVWGEKLGFNYYSISTKDEFNSIVGDLVQPEIDGPIIVECFTKVKDESDALELITNLDRSYIEKLAKNTKNFLPKSTVSKIKAKLGKN